MFWKVGDIVSIIMMPPVEETNWWRGKKVYEVNNDINLIVVSNIIY